MVCPFFIVIIPVKVEHFYQLLTKRQTSDGISILIKLGRIYRDSQRIWQNDHHGPGCA